MQQASMFEDFQREIPPHPAKARKSDPEPSHIAAEMADSFSASHRGVIVRALAKFGRMSVDQIASRTPLMSQQVNKRLPELERDGIVRVVKDENGVDLLVDSLSGRPERVWELAQ